MYLDNFESRSICGCVLSPHKTDILTDVTLLLSSIIHSSINDISLIRQRFIKSFIDCGLCVNKKVHKEYKHIHGICYEEELA